MIARDRRQLLSTSMRRSLLLALGGLISACATQSTTQPANFNLSGFPPAFKQGYADGCASVRGPVTRNEARFKSDSQYAAGWRDGLDICRRYR